ncbi:hypothetical protein GCM10010265_06360 [Streptomyces griseoincarnatus]|nr:hypothetical protein GCM10010265_06360 [Streptomyces griseoincarnatus]
MGVGARSGWRVHAPNLSSTHSRARPRTTTPTAAPHHHPTLGATATPTAQNPAPQAHDLNPHRTQPNAAGALPQPIAACTTSRPSAALRRTRLQAYSGGFSASSTSTRTPCSSARTPASQTAAAA